MHMQAFVLMVSLSFEREADKAAFVRAWRAQAAHVRCHEPGTLSFELLQPDSGTSSDAAATEVVVYER